MCGAICLVVGLGVLTWNQVQVWHDSEKLWTHALATYPQSSVAENNLGVVRARESKLAEAIEHYQRALQIRPGYAEVHYNWGNVLALQGKLAEAAQHYQRALQINPDFAQARSSLRDALRGGGGTEVAAPSRKIPDAGSVR